MKNMACFCVFAGAANGPDESFVQEIETVGKALTIAGHNFIYGEADWSMGPSGVLSENGQTAGVIPHLNDREVGNENVTRLITTETMHERKKIMYDAADAFLILPGGLGSLDETMEVMTWRQLGLLDSDIFIYDYKSYWQPMAALFDHVVANGFMHTTKFDYVHWANDRETLLSLINHSSV